ncbi:sugar transferase [Clostridium gasigenes]|uniref:sugar transferase n=1 Tax=Clostridium gasigenes TaxID=94869 RepID=UPI001C0D3937|nr:sugar transferase [Clostridium gasigenes]MBU3107568.1 sugar transferase [Clostridium gasigenes]
MENIFIYASYFFSIAAILISIIMLSNISLKSNLNKVNTQAKEFNLNEIKQVRSSKGYLFVKRIIDLVFGITSFIVLIPTFLLVSIMIKLESGGNIFIKREVCAQYRKKIYVYKFKTRYKDVGSESNKLEYTRVGRFLYRTAIDQLPMIINVIKGEMSIIGVGFYDNDRYNKFTSVAQENINRVKPGIVSLWAISLDKQKFDFENRQIFDLIYIDNLSLSMDISIMIKTFFVAFGVAGDY